MARQPRIYLPGGLYHVMLRGNDREAIFYNDNDRTSLSELLQEGVSRFGYQVHAFCWMPNHLHMAIQIAEIPLSKIMQNLSFRYTRWINRQHHRVGHLFQGRYKALLVEADSYVLALVRYIHLNPVRAQLVTTPEDYPWSSHRAYLGQETISWLTTDWVLSLLANQRAMARRRYMQFVWDGIEEGHREDFHRGAADTRVLGSTTFIEQALGKRRRRPVLSLDEVVVRVCAEYRVTEAQLRARGRGRLMAEARAVIALLAMQMGSATLTAVGERFGRDVATLSITVRRLVERSRSCELLRDRLARLGVGEEE